MGHYDYSKDTYFELEICQKFRWFFGRKDDTKKDTL